MLQQQTFVTVPRYHAYAAAAARKTSAEGQSAKSAVGTTGGIRPLRMQDTRRAHRSKKNPNNNAKPVLDM